MTVPADDRAVVDRLRSAITGGELLPGERLVELDLAARYGVGRAAVRSALLELTKEGLVERTAHRGARVRPVTREEAMEITEVRQVVEGLCAAKAAERATPAEAAALRAIVEAMRAAVASNELVRYSELNRQLHQRVRDAGRHTTAAAIVGQLRNQLMRHQFRLAFVPGRAALSLDEHAEIVDAIVAGEAERARKAMEAHLAGVVDALASQPQEAWT